VNRGAVVAIAVILALVIAGVGYQALFSGGGPTSTTFPTVTSSGASSSSIATSSSGCSTAAYQPATDWTTYHGNNSRTGDVTAPISGQQVQCVKPGWVSQGLNGEVYAEPLVYHGIVVIATEMDVVYGLNLTSGAMIWSSPLGTPVNGSTLQCGDINPTGITGTPVIDPVTGTVYVVAFESPGAHYLVAIDIHTGRVEFKVPADPPGADPLVQQERGALSLGNGRVYVMYGGLAGDCGDYHGWVVGLNEDGSPGMVSYEVPTQREAGIWAPSGAAMDASGNLFVATGNGASTSTFDFSNAVIELSPTLQELGYFAPSDWVQLNQGDTDLGSVGPMLLGHGEIFQIGKEGVGYLLNASNLGGVGGELFASHVCSSAFGGMAFAGSIVFVSCTDGLFALNTTSSLFSLLWKGPGFPAGPPIVTGDIVWVVDTSNGRLHGFEAKTGTEVFSAQTGPVTMFTTPSTASGWVIVAAGNKVCAFHL